MIRTTHRTFLACFITGVFALSTTPLTRAATMSPLERLPRATPESQGVSSVALLALVEAADTQVDTFHSLMLIRHGHVVAEGWWAPCTASDPHMLYSLSKSFTSTAVGLAASEGKLSIYDPVLTFFPEDAPASPGENLRHMRIHDLLIMSSGQHADVIADFPLHTLPDAIRTFLSWPVAHKPGTLFVYNSPGTFMQSAIVQKVTGQTVSEYLRPRLFEPLGIADPHWEMSKQGIDEGASGMNIRTEDIACFGQMLLQRGLWNGKQIVPAAWIDEATAKQTSNGSDPNGNWDQGYGYQYWRCKHGFYRADGAFGQLCIVMQQYDAVLVATSAVKDTANQMDVIWDKLLPAFANAPLPADPAGEKALKEKLASLSVRAPKGEAASPLESHIAGRTYVFPANDRHIESITLEVAANGEPSLIIRGQGYDGHPIAVGHDAWKRGRTTFGTDIDARDRYLVDRAVAARGGWTLPDVFEAKLCYYETPYALSIKLQFGGDIVALSGDYNLSFQPNALPDMIGRAK